MMAFVSFIINGLEVVDKGSVLIPRQAKVESRFYHTVKEIIPTIYFHKLFLEKE
jgi:membrane protein required for colicin V production